MTFSEKAQAAWKNNAPEWVCVLAEECDRTSLRKTAQAIDVSCTFVSLAINAKREKVDFIKKRVEESLMQVGIACPVLGLISQPECLQSQVQPYSSVNPIRIELYTTCRRCQYFKGEK